MAGRGERLKAREEGRRKLVQSKGRARTVGRIRMGRTTRDIAIESDDFVASEKNDGQEVRCWRLADCALHCISSDGLVIP
jgi:flagellar basal body rod protein FlgF